MIGGLEDRKHPTGRRKDTNSQFRKSVKKTNAFAHMYEE